jgi:hypothetical protein
MRFSNSKALAALLGLTALFLLGLFSTELADSDAWWRLKTGQYIVTQHRADCRDHGTVPGLCREPAAVSRSDSHASRLGGPHQPAQYIHGAGRRRAAVLGRRLRSGPAQWLPQRAGDGDRAHGHYRLHDGLPALAPRTPPLQPATSQPNRPPLQAPRTPPPAPPKTSQPGRPSCLPPRRCPPKSPEPPYEPRFRLAAAMLNPR